MNRENEIILDFKDENQVIWTQDDDEEENKIKEEMIKDKNDQSKDIEWKPQHKSANAQINTQEDLDSSLAPTSQNTDINTIPAPANSVINMSKEVREEDD